MKICQLAFACALLFFSCKKSDQTDPQNNIQVPNKPATLKSTVVSASRVRITWADSSNNEDGFFIERKTDGSSYTTVGTTTMNTISFEDLNIQADSIYTYRVFSHNAAGKSVEPSNTITIKTTAVSITQLSFGGKIWSKENLEVSQYLNGDAIPEVSSPLEWENLTSGAWCWYNNDS